MNERAKVDSGRLVRLALIGFGKLAEDYYLPALRGIGGVQLTAVVDPLPVRRQRASELLTQIKTGPSLSEVLKQASLDAVLVASPPSTHLPILREMCRLGVPVFLEKPFVLPGELTQAVETAGNAPALMVNFNRRLWPLYDQVRNMVLSGVIGDFQDALFRFNVYVQPWLTVTDHRLRPNEGGVLYDLGSQMLDLMCFLLDEQPVSVQAISVENDTDTASVALALEFPLGQIGKVELGYGKRNREEVSIRGNKGVIQVPDPNMTIHERGDSQGKEGIQIALSDWLTLGYRGLVRRNSMLRHTIRASLTTFVEAVRGLRPFSPGIEDAIRNAVLLEAAHESLSSGREVAMRGTREKLHV